MTERISFIGFECIYRLTRSGGPQYGAQYGAPGPLLWTPPMMGPLRNRLLVVRYIIRYVTGSLLCANIFA